MTPKTRAAMQQRLERLRAGVLATGPAKAEPTRKDTSAVGVPDEDEQALAEMMQILASNRNRKQSDLIGAIDRALRKIAEQPASYGECEECGDPIAARRLELMPYVTLCLECQAEKDPRRGTRRSSLTDFDT